MSKVLMLIASFVAMFGLNNHYNSITYTNIGEVQEKKESSSFDVPQLDSNVIVLNEEIVGAESKYDFSNYDTLKNFSDVIIIGNFEEIQKVSNFNEKSQKYGSTLTYTKVNIKEILKSNDDNLKDTVDVAIYGGTIPYNEYKKSLLPAQIEKREALMKSSNITDFSNVYISSSMINQLKIEPQKTYIMFLEYLENYDKYFLVSEEYGLQEYDVENRVIKNHITGEEKVNFIA